MIQADKIAGAREKIKQGHPVAEVKASLRSEGFTEEEIAACFPAHQYDMRTWYFLFGIVTAIAGCFVLLSFGSWLLIVLSTLLFSMYVKERIRLKK